MIENKNDPLLSDEIRSFYNIYEEAGRLESPEGQIEKNRTRELMVRYLPSAPAVVLDVGGGSGVHAFWLAERGYQVHLIDGVPRHIEQAEETARQFQTNPLASINLGDARQLDQADNSIDSVLMFGPLYHLTERRERLLALREAHRVLRSGGVVLAVAITRFASTIIALLEGLVADPIFAPIYEKDLVDGQHRNPTGDTAYFTTSFFHYPHELEDEIIAAGFKFEGLLAIEGPARLMKDFVDQSEKDEVQEKILSIVRKVEAEPNLWGVSAHIMGIGKKI